MKTLPHPDRDALTLEHVLAALSDPIRLDVVRELAGAGELCCGSLGMPVAKSTASHHFRVLREAGVIGVRQDGTQRYVSLRRNDLDARFPGLLAAILGERGPRRRGSGKSSGAKTSGPPVRKKNA